MRGVPLLACHGCKGLANCLFLERVGERFCGEKVIAHGTGVEKLPESET